MIRPFSHLTSAMVIPFYVGYLHGQGLGIYPAPGGLEMLALGLVPQAAQIPQDIVYRKDLSDLERKNDLIEHDHVSLLFVTGAMYSAGMLVSYVN
ncbi:hypothetical protein H6504_04115 [Candidatus Woesearchaeota archaeon]|nr:hypothetical protein [Candidatus Woesearchaeota archaeon]